MADIPGIIEGAAEGAGLGHDFLRHIDRCRLLVHIVDVSGSEDRDPIEDFEKINAELRDYSPELAERPMIVAANKCDLIPEAATISSVCVPTSRSAATRSMRSRPPRRRARSSSCASLSAVCASFRP